MQQQCRFFQILLPGTRIVFSHSNRHFHRPAALSPDSPHISSPGNSCRLYILLPVLLAAVLSVTGCSDQRQQAQKLLAESIELRGAGRHAEALQKLSQAVALAPELAEAHFNRGLCLTTLNRPAEAVLALETAVRLKPRWAAALQALGLAQLDDNNTTAAEQSLSQAIEADSRLTTALFARSRLRLKALQESAALEDLDTVIRKSPEHLEARLQRARLLLESHPEQAVEDLTVFLQRDRLNAEALLLRGRAWGNAGNQQRALTDLAAACQLNPELHTAWRERGRQLRLAGDPDAARRDLQQAHLLVPQDADTLFEMALTEQVDGKLETTAELLQQVLEISPQHAAARLESAASLLRSDKPEAAVTILQQLLQDPLPAGMNPAVLNDARLQLACIFEQLQQPDAALQQTVALLAERPHDEAAHRLHARLLQQLHKPAEALQEYMWLVSHNGTDPELRLLRASLHSETQQFNAALQDLNTVLELTPAQPDALELRASVWQAMGDHAAALRDVDTLMQQPSVSPALRRKRADLLTLLQRPSDAASEYLHPDLLPQASEQVLQTLVSQTAAAGDTSALLDLLARASAACPSAVSTELKLQQVELLVEHGQPDAAASTLQQLTGEEQLLPKALLLAARIQLAHEHLPEAASLLLQIPEESRTPEILQILANTLIRSGQPAEARRILNRLIQINPADISCRIQRLEILTTLRAWTETEEDLEVVLLNNPNCTVARLARGMQRVLAGDYTAALQDLESDAVRKFDTPDSIWARSRCLIAASRTTQALAELTRLLELAPDHHEARLCRADLEFRRGNLREASADYSLLLKSQPGNTSVLLKRAQLLLKAGQHAAAEADLLQVLKQQPLSAEAWHLRGLARSQLGRTDEARRDLERSLRLNPQNTPCLFDLADLEANAGRSAAAVTLYDAALQLKPDNAVGWYNRGLVHYRLNQYSEAVAAWSKAIEIRPTLNRAWSSRAAAYSALSQHIDARRDLEQVLALKPGDPQAWEQYARLLINCPDKAVRDTRKAVLAARKACELSEFHDWKLLALLAETLDANGEQTLALKWAEKARQTAPAAQRTAPAQLARSLQHRIGPDSGTYSEQNTRTASRPETPAQL